VSSLWLAGQVTGIDLRLYGHGSHRLTSACGNTSPALAMIKKHGELPILPCLLRFKRIDSIE